MGVIVTPVSAVIDSGGPGFGSIGDTFNHSSLAPDYTSGVTDFDAYLALNPQHSEVFPDFEWFSELGTSTAQVTYDLGSEMVIDALALWNEESSGIGTLDLYYSTDNVNFFALSLGLLPTDNAITGGTYGADQFFFAPTSLRYVQFRMSDCPQPDGDTPPFMACAIGEVAFRVADEIVVSSGVSSGFDLVQPPCVTRWTQAVKITRRFDGVSFRFTTLDRDLEFRGETYIACHSVDTSATSTTSELGQIGNSEISGLLSVLDIDEAQLYGGLFDDAFVEIWLVPWQGGDEPRRLAAGWTGKVTHSASRYIAEVLGPGSRLEQKPIVQTFTPGCRWIFGDPNTCTVDIEALKATGDVVSVVNRGMIYAAIVEPSGLAQWEDGRLRWTSGVNLGQTCEVKTVDFITGQIVLWALPAFLPEVGDTFDLLPGCAQDVETCKTVYGNFINYGGFPDVPGQDAIMASPNAKA